MGEADGLELLVGVGDAVATLVGLGVTSTFGFEVGVGVSVVDGFRAVVGVVVGLTKIIRMAPSSGIGETTGFFLVRNTSPMRATILKHTIMRVIAATVLLRSSIQLIIILIYEYIPMIRIKTR